MTRELFITQQADLALDEAQQAAKRGGPAIAADDHSAIRFYIGEALNLMEETGYDPYTEGLSAAERAARKYALYKEGVLSEAEWKTARQSWRRRAAIDRRKELFPRADGEPDEYGQVGSGTGFTIHPFYGTGTTRVVSTTTSTPVDSGETSLTEGEMNDLLNIIQD